MPVAVNCLVVPFTIEGFAGVTAIDTRVAAVTVSEVDAVMLPVAAWMVTEPADTDVVSP